MSGRRFATVAVFPIRVPKHYIPYLFMLDSPDALMEKPPLLGQVADGRDGNVSCLLGVKIQAIAFGKVWKRRN